MNIIVFSKDRSLQLDLFIRSFYKYVIDPYNYKINILYTYSNMEFKNGYDILIEYYKYVNFIKEEKFKSDLLLLIPNKQYTVFFVDDDIFKERIDFYDKQELLFKNNLDIICRSLRLHPNLKECYPTNLIYTTHPSFYEINDSFIFEWVNQQGDYGYPMSLDGHIFRTNDIIQYMTQLDYNSPNTLESKLSNIYIKNKTKMICYNNSIIVNNPCNIVQNIHTNRHGEEYSDELNDKFLKNERISLDNIDNINNISCHQEIKIILIKTI